jgi:hypothetical protein
VVHLPRGRLRTRVDFEDAQGGDEETKSSGRVDADSIVRQRRFMTTSPRG